MNWQPIETAPKDRKILFLYAGKEGLASVGNWEAQEDYDNPNPYWRCQLSSFGVRWMRENPPTHWCDITFPECKKT